MNARIRFLAVTSVIPVILSGCVAPPAAEPARPAPAQVAAPPHAAPSTEALEAHHHERARIHAKALNWADALVHWELLALLKPDSQEYRTSVADTRRRIRETADAHARAAEQAQRQGNLDQATLMYLRVLNVDRGNEAAAQALRDIDAERTRRAYLNRPPR
jgi:tetratricopeptide (TPR) repeat protein